MYSCTCAAGRSGSVWGAGPYTADSDVCAAARHAGVIGADGGPVTALAVPGLSAYSASSANGITTGSWGGYDRSMVFDRNAGR